MNCCCGNQNIGISNQQATPIQVSVDCCGLNNNFVRQRQHVTDSTKLIEGGQLSGCSPGLQTTQNFISCDQ